MSRRRSLSRVSTKPSAPSSSASPSKKSNKYQAQKIEVDGFRFDSKKEAARYGELKLLQMAGEISDLKVHPKYKLEIDGQKICEYWADFEYLAKDDDGLLIRQDYSGFWRLVVEDVKGMKKGAAWKIFRIKAKLMKAVYDIEVQVI